MTLRRSLVTSPLLVVAVVVVALGSGCSTIIKPTRPSDAVVAEGNRLPGVRFDGEEVQIREPGMPLSPSRSWQREVANHTATTLNKLLVADDTAPAARTVVSFDLASPSVIQIGTWKEMTITMTSTLPDGSVVRSQPLSGNIDDPLEYATVTSLGVAGTLLDITAGVASIAFILFQDFTTGLIFVGALIGGLTLNLAQSGSQYVVAGSEETRWSNLYLQALKQHAKDVRAGIGKGPPPGTSLPATPKTLPPANGPNDAVPGRVGPGDPSDLPPLLEAPPPTPPTPPPTPPPTTPPTSTAPPAP